MKCPRGAARLPWHASDWMDPMQPDGQRPTTIDDPHHTYFSPRVHCKSPQPTGTVRLCLQQFGSFQEAADILVAYVQSNMHACLFLTIPCRRFVVCGCVRIEVLHNRVYIIAALTSDYNEDFVEQTVGMHES